MGKFHGKNTCEIISSLLFYFKYSLKYEYVSGMSRFWSLWYHVEFVPRVICRLCLQIGPYLVPRTAIICYSFVDHMYHTIAGYQCSYCWFVVCCMQSMQKIQESGSCWKLMVFLQLSIWTRISKTMSCQRPFWPQESCDHYQNCMNYSSMNKDTLFGGGLCPNYQYWLHYGQS